MTTSSMSNSRSGFIYSLRAWISDGDQHLRKKQLYEQNAELLENQGIIVVLSGYLMFYNNVTLFVILSND